MKKILVAVDGSEASARATQVAARLALDCRADLTIVHVIEPAPTDDDLSHIYSGFEQLRESSGQRVLDTLKGRLGSLSVKMDLLLMRGKPAETLARLAKDGGYDLLAVGSKGRGSVSRVWVGSVTDRLIHIGEAPVMVIP